MQIDPYLSSFSKLKCKWAKDNSIKPESLNIIEEKVGDNLELTVRIRLSEQNTISTGPKISNY